jgi:hypothetical protein
MRGEKNQNVFYREVREGNEKEKNLYCGAHSTRFARSG